MSPRASVLECDALLSSRATVARTGNQPSSHAGRSRWTRRRRFNRTRNKAAHSGALQDATAQSNVRCQAGGV